MDSEPVAEAGAITDTPGESTTDAVRVGGLTYTYPGADEPALRGIDFTIGRGEVFGFLGPSGAGKSTTQKVLVGLLDGYEGRVTVLGTELSEWGGEYYERIGVSSEAPNHYLKLTGRENLALFGSLYAGETRDPTELLELVGLADAADQRVSGYSKGMRMRLNFVRALAHDPDVLFLDEPTTGLDPTNSRNIRGIVRDLRDRGTTIFLTTHDMVVADDLCDRVAFVIDGRLPVVDAPGTLKRAYGAPRVRVEHRKNGALETTDIDLADLPDDERFRSILSAGEIERIHSEDATLEDVFIAVTGSELR